MLTYPFLEIITMHNVEGEWGVPALKQILYIHALWNNN